MKKLAPVFLVVAAGISGLALGPSGAGTTVPASTPRRLHVSGLEMLALDGDRVAYDVAASRTSHKGKIVRHPNRVFVWNVRTGKTINVSGRRGTRADSRSSPVVTFMELAIAGTRVAWLTRSRFNVAKGEDDLYASSVRRPKVRRVARVVRYGDDCGKMVHHHGCTGNYLGQLVGGGGLIAVNRWTFTADRWPQLTNGGLDALNGAKLRTLATGGDTIWAVDVDQRRVVVLRDSSLYAEETVGLYSSTGAPLISVTPSVYPGQVALSGHNLVVFSGSKLALYDADNGSLKRTFTLPGKSIGPGDVQGNIAVYAAGRSMRAVNLTSGKDRIVGRLPHPITLARIDSVGLVYANNAGYTNTTRPTAGRHNAGPIVFLPMKQIAAAVS